MRLFGGIRAVGDGDAPKNHAPDRTPFETVRTVKMPRRRRENRRPNWILFAGTRSARHRRREGRSITKQPAISEVTARVRSDGAMDTARQPSEAHSLIGTFDLRDEPADGGKAWRATDRSRNSHPNLTPSPCGADHVVETWRMTPNVKHQRARATASRANGTISLRALRCMR